MSTPESRTAAGPRILLAPDKFKGSATAEQVAQSIAAGIRRVRPDARITILPIADGGEGTIDAVVLAGADRRVARVRDPLGRSTEAGWAVIDAGGRRSAVVESAAASGLAFVAPDVDSALRSSSAGTGQLIAAALDEGVDEVVVTLGGSAMTDGGAGALAALGARLRDDRGAVLDDEGALTIERVAELDLSGLDPRLASLDLRLAVDVDNPLTGERGAAAVFSPQKGADAATVARLDRALRRWARVLFAATGVDPDRAGCGAAGGFPSAFVAAAGAELVAGSELVAQLIDLEAAIVDADLVVVGEGSLDEQSLGGKAPIAAARMAAAAGVPVAAVAGVCSVSEEALRAEGVLWSVALVDLAPSVAAARAEAPRWLEIAGERIAAELRGSAPE
ncbi:glycerate kinase [Mycetocola reblochoni]|uniref:Glycerate kinase n=2 Tax=Mycetocola reblochoni TaxID=331618 RepID=A0A1R4IWE1_9MICO|nr:glycerate kinase [Mycetocola reblochoni]RLP70956.1 glycerate kinase [Mycetocola reblochoni]SJN24211.1 Glycerate kinase [Mycetocola reblochoni REB411]